MQIALSAQATAQRGLVVALACLATCVGIASVYLAQPVLPDIAAAFGIPVAQARLAFSVPSFTYALAFFAFAPLSDRIDARRMAGLGLGINAILLVAASRYRSFDMLLAALALQGVSAAAVPSAMYALVPRIAGREQVGTYFGWILAASVLGITLGRSAMGLLVGALGLGGALQAAAVVLAATAAALRLLPREAAPALPRTTLLQAYARTLGMLATPRLLRLFAVGFLLFFGYLGVVTLLSLRLAAPPLSWGSSTLGAVSLVGVAAALGAPLSGRLTARLGTAAVALLGLAVVAGGISVLALAQGVPAVGLGLFLVFLGVFSTQPAVFTRLSRRVEPESRGAASSLFVLTCLGAGSLASAAQGPVWSLWGWPVVVGAALTAVALSGACLAVDARIQAS